MTSETFEGVVVNGQLTHESLTAFEGQHVYVTVIAPNGRNGTTDPVADTPGADQASPKEQKPPQDAAGATPAAKVASHCRPGPTMIRAEDLPGGTEEEVEPPEWLDVEKDFIINMPSNWKPLPPGTKIVDRGRGRPIWIFPEELPDE